MFFFFGNVNATCWKAFMEADDEITDCLFQLRGTASIPSDDTLALIELELMCHLYLPKTEMSSVSKVRWWLFRKKQTQSERLPPTQAALREAILKAHHQVLVWNKDVVANCTLPSPENYGWELHEEKWVPIMTTLHPAPQAIINLVKCKCSEERCSTNRCQCKKNGLYCIDLCGCSDNGEQCENVLDDDSDKEDDHDDQDDDYDDVDDVLTHCWKSQLSAAQDGKKKFWFWLGGKMPLSIRIKQIPKLVYLSARDWPVNVMLLKLTWPSWNSKSGAVWT